MPSARWRHFGESAVSTAGRGPTAPGVDQECAKKCKRHRCRLAALRGMWWRIPKTQNGNGLASPGGRTFRQQRASACSPYFSRPSPCRLPPRSGVGSVRPPGIWPGAQQGECSHFAASERNCSSADSTSADVSCGSRGPTGCFRESKQYRECSGGASVAFSLMRRPDRRDRQQGSGREWPDSDRDRIWKPCLGRNTR